MAVESYPVTDRASWLAMREGFIGASEIAALAGLSTFMTALDVYARKTGLTDDTAETSVMRRGRWLEAAILSALAEERPEWGCRAAGIFAADTDARFAATPDILTATGEPVEGKCPTPRKFEEEWGGPDGAPPVGYQLQALSQAMLLGAPRAWVAALVVDGWDAQLHLYEVPRHDGAEARIRALVADFWRRVAEADPPAATNGRDAEALAALFPRETPTVLNLAGDNALPELLDERAAAKAAIREAERRVDEIDDEIKGKLGDAAEARLPGWKITWKSQSRKEIVIPAKTFRVLRITEIREREIAA